MDKALLPNKKLSFQSLYNNYKPTHSYEITKYLRCSEILPPLYVSDKKDGYYEIPRKVIDHVLSYCHINERRVISGFIKGDFITTKNKFMSPTYTVSPVKYLSSSEICISLAQTTHLFLEYFVSYPSFKYKTFLDRFKLHKLRMDHALYFTNLEIKFKEKYPEKPYMMRVKIINYKKIDSIFFAKFEFDIDKKILGSFLGVCSLA